MRKHAKQIIRELYKFQNSFIEHSSAWELMQTAIDYIHRLEYDNENSDKEIRRLQAENKEYCQLIDIGNNRKYRQKFIEEVWKEEMGNELSIPDFDFIYQKYFEMRQDRDNWRNSYYHIEHLFPEIKEVIVEKQEAEDE